MIITCHKCSTSFNLDDSLVKKDGSKVRCSVCRDVFIAYPLPAESDRLESEESMDLELETDLEEDIFEEPSELKMEDSDLSLEDDVDPGAQTSELEIEAPEPELDFEPEFESDPEPEMEMDDSSFEIDDDFSFEDSELEIDEGDDVQKLELEDDSLEFEADNIEFDDSGFDDSEEGLDEIEFETIEEDEISLPDNEGAAPALEMEDETDVKMPDKPAEDDVLTDEDEFELEFDVEDDTEDLVTDIPDPPSDQISLEPAKGSDEKDSSLSSEEEAPTLSQEDDFSEYDEVLEQETEPDEDFLEKETIEIDEPPVIQPEPSMDMPARSRRRKKKPLVGAPVLALLLIFFLLAGAYIASIMTGYKIPYLSDIKIPFIEQYLKKSAPEKSEIKPIPNQKSVNGRFVTNSSAGALFVITGRVENPSDTACSYIEIRGALITKGKKEAKTKNAFCGNIITEEMLKTGKISQINKLLSVKQGNNNLNINIKPGGSVPFMVVFSDLPEKLQNFTVKVISFKKTKTR